MDPIKFDERIFDFWTKKRSAAIMHLEMTRNGKEIVKMGYRKWKQPYSLHTIKRGNRVKMRIDGKLYSISRRK